MGACASAILTGLLLSSCFPPREARLLAWCALIPLLLALARVGRRGFVPGFVAGLVFRLLSMPWVMALLHHHAGASRLVSAGAFLLLSAYLAVYTGLFAAALGRAIDRWGAQGMLLAPSLWVALEWANASLLTGFHWNPLSASQAPVTRFAGVVGVAGAPGLSFLIVLANAGLAALLLRRAGGASRGAGSRAPRALLAGGVLLALVPVSGLASPPAAEGPGRGTRQLRLRLVGPAVPQAAKWTLSFQRRAFSRLASLSRAGPGVPDLVVWPEAALPFPFDANPSGAAAVRRLARSIGAPILFGSPGRRRGGKGGAVTNSAFLVDGGGKLAGRYDKRRRVPFGEYVPLRPLLPFIPALATGLARGDLAAGNAAAIFRVRGARLGPLICYEAIFGDLAADSARAGAEALVNLTNDAWLGEAGSAQHFAMARLRAVERGVPLVRVANGGTSAVIDATGAVRCALPGGSAAAADCTLRLAPGTPPKRPFQRAFPPACALLAFLALAWPPGRHASFSRLPPGAGL